MITVNYAPDTYYGFSVDTDSSLEYSWFKDNMEKLMDVIVDGLFINTDTTDIHTYADYFKFCTDIDFCLERFYGHPVRSRTQLELIDFVIISQELTKNLALNDVGLSAIQSILNEEYQEYTWGKRL